MELITHFFTNLETQLGTALWYVLGFIIIVGVVAQWRLFDKAGLPGWTCVVPVLGQVNYLKMVGRPAWHLLLFFIPVYNIYLLFRVWIETAQSFGKRSIVDYVLVIVLNGLYIFNLGMSYETRYLGPVYGKHIGEHPGGPAPSLA